MARGGRFQGGGRAANDSGEKRQWPRLVGGPGHRKPADWDVVARWQEMHVHVPPGPDSTTPLSESAARYVRHNLAVSSPLSTRGRDVTYAPLMVEFLVHADIPEPQRSLVCWRELAEAAFLGYEQLCDPLALDSLG